MSICFVAVPSVLQASEPKQLLTQWQSIYHTGHMIMPSIAVGTGVLYACSSLSRLRAQQPWAATAVAGFATVCIAPFTWTFMGATNGKLFGLAAEPAPSPDISKVKALVVQWASLHFVRSLLPVIGVVIGTLSTRLWE